MRQVRPHTAKPSGRRRALHQPGHDGPGDPERPAGHHRLGASLDLRPVSAPEDRRGTHRRDPRVHRLQRVRVAGQHCDAGSSAPRTRPRARSTGVDGIPSALRRVADPVEGVWWSVAGRRDSSAAIVLAKRGVEYVHVVDDGAATGRAHGLGPATSRARPSGRGSSTTGRPWPTKLSNLTLIPKKRLSTDDILDYGAEVVILTTGSVLGHETASRRLPARPCPAPMRTLRHCAHARADHGRAAKTPPGERVLVYDARRILHGRQSWPRATRGRESE